MTKFFQTIFYNFKTGIPYFSTALVVAFGLAFVAIHLFPLVGMVYEDKMIVAFASALLVSYALTSIFAITALYEKEANGKPYAFKVLMKFASTIIATPIATWLIITFIRDSEASFYTELIITWVTLNTLTLLVFSRE